MKQIVVMAGIHGNEQLGVTVINRLQQEITDKNITFIIGNPEAYKKNVRFCDEDLNRLFGTEPITHNSYETARAKVLMPILAQADILIDIHSTIKPSVPFIYCENTEEHLKIARHFDVPYIVSPHKDFKPTELCSSTDNYVDRHGGIGITLETGWHKDHNCEEHIYTALRNFIKGNIQKNHPKQLEIYDHIIPETEDFSFDRDYHNFDHYHTGDFIIFPKTTFIPGKAAAYLAKP